MALGLAALPERARLARLAAIVRHGLLSIERARQVCNEFHEEPAMADAVFTEAKRQARVRLARPRPWRFVRLTVEERRAALVRQIFGRAHYHEPPYADFLDVHFESGAAFALVMPYGRRAARATLVVRMRGHRLLNIRVPVALRTIGRTLEWLVRDDVPEGAAGDALWQWLMERGGRTKARRND